MRVPNNQTIQLCSLLSALHLPCSTVSIQTEMDSREGRDRGRDKDYNDMNMMAQKDDGPQLQCEII